MKKLFFSTQGTVFANIADLAKENALLGCEVLIVKCNESICHCWGNMECNKGICSLCKMQVDRFVKQMPPSVRIINIDDYSKDTKEEEILSLTFDYESVEDIKNIEYDGVNIGYGCLSNYVSFTRNLNPLIDNEFREYFDSFLRKTCYLVYCQKEILQRESPDHIYFFNGRFNNVRPLVELAKSMNLEYTCTEGTYFFEGKVFQNNFENSMPHSIEYNTRLMENAWNDISVSQSEKEWLGNRFFKSKIDGNFTGDTNYTAGQALGQLPEGWDTSKKNYVIFNSSEDEFFSIGDEYDKKKVFNTQVEGISFIAESLQNRDDVHLYLRIHPNLKNIKYRYHLDLLELGTKYKNLTVIPGNSPISSYSLIGVADRIIVFGSTIGAESSYFGKAVINLAGAPYSGLDITYTPKTPEELLPLLQAEILENNANKKHLLMFGYYYMYTKRPRTVFFSHDLKPIKFLAKKVFVLESDKLFGSNILFLMYQKLVKTLGSKKNIPIKENSVHLA